MAYVLGFWWADGCIYRGQMIDFTTHATDKYILNRIKEELQFDGELMKYKDRQAYRLNFSCIEMYKDICNLGGTERKSLTAIFPIIPKEFLRDFVRGYFDGDGCVYYVKGKRLNSSFASGNKDFLISLQNFLKENAGIKGGSICLSNASCYSLQFGKRDSILLGHYMYDGLDNNLFLLRKYEKFNTFFKEENEL